MPAEVIAFIVFPVAAICLVMAARRFLRQRFCEGALLLLPVAFEALAIKSAICMHEDWKGVDLNACPSLAEVVGVWQRDDDRVEFRSDGTFVDSLGSVTRLEAAPCVGFGPFPEWVFIRKHGKLRLLPIGPHQDPDEWNLHLLYQLEVQPLLPLADGGV